MRDPGEDPVFRAAYAAWRREPFPPGSPTSDSVDELHADLVLVDDYVANDVIPLLGGRAYRQPSPVDVPGAIDELESRIAAQTPRVSKDDDRAALGLYGRYCSLLRGVWEAGRRLSADE